MWFFSSGLRAHLVFVGLEERVSQAQRRVGRQDEGCERIRALVAPILEQEGYDVLLVEVLSKGALLRIYIDQLEQEHRISVTDCVVAARLLEELPALDAFFSRPYHLEMSSPGVERPLVREKDFVRFVGERAQITLREPRDGRRRFIGTIAGVDDGDLRLEMGKKTSALVFRLEDVARAKLKPETSTLFGKK